MNVGKIRSICDEKGITSYMISGGNHSLETGDTDTDLKNLSVMMKMAEEYICGGI